MKTEMYKCSECHVVQFRWRDVDSDSPEPCGIVRRVTVDIEGTEVTSDQACPGVYEYYAYDDFDQYK